MNTFRWCWVSAVAVGMALAPDGQAQRQSRSFSVGYVYPAGAQQGTTSEHVIAGQFLGGLTNIYVSGGGVTATITDFIHPIQGGELNRLRILVDELIAKRAVVRKDFKTLENFRSFKNAKDIKKDAAAEDKEIEELKKKYANATWTAEDEKMLADARRRISSGVRRPANPAICELVVCNLTVAPDAEPGRREIRLATASGLSNPLVFWIGQVPEVSEPASKNIAEQRSSIARAGYGPVKKKTTEAPAITLPAVINGQILPGEVDRHRFKAAKGQKLVIAVQAQQLIPYISDAVPGWFQATLSLYDGNGRELAYDDDFRFQPDPVIYYEVPADGEYIVEIKDSIYRGREDFVYRISIGETPFITGIFPLGGPAGSQTTVELKGWNLPATSLTMDATGKAPGVYPLSIRKDKQVSNFVPFAVDTLPECTEQETGGKSRPQRVSLPVIVNGRIGKPDDTDVFCFEGKAGEEIVAEVMARRLNSPLDSVLRLTDATGNQIAFNDDNTDKGAGLTTHHADSYLTATLPKDGTYLLYLSDTQHKGGPDYGYRLRISPPQPDFALRVTPSAISARPGDSVAATVYALRKDGFSGPISIHLKDAPPGFKLGTTLVPANTNQVKITLTAPLAPQKEPATIQFEGRATVNDREIVRPAVPADDRMQAFEYRHLVPAQEMKVAVAGTFMPKGIGAAVKIASDLPVKIPAGGAAKVKLTAPARAMASRLRLELAEAPAGIVIKSVSPAEGGLEVELGADPAKLKPGQSGALIVAAYPAPPPPPPPRKNQNKPPPKPKPQLVYKGKPLGLLPAITYEITRN